MARSSPREHRRSACTTLPSACSARAPHLATKTLSAASCETAAISAALPSVPHVHTAVEHHADTHGTTACSVSHVVGRAVASKLNLASSIRRTVCATAWPAAVAPTSSLRRHACTCRGIAPMTSSSGSPCWSSPCHTHSPRARRNVSSSINTDTICTSSTMASSDRPLSSTSTPRSVSMPWPPSSDSGVSTLCSTDIAASNATAPRRTSSGTCAIVLSRSTTMRTDNCSPSSRVSVC
mmetsp:Transcript_32642/g.98526  ORF Transcript_32642/g.98526 Transcript_32642/m.98526 type:complete len:237 (-) Transcript_32642:364-1074(-)